MTTTIAVTAPAAGTYNVVVQKPSGAETTIPFTSTSAGQVQTNVYGNVTVGFGTLVNLVGTYNVYVTQGGQTVATTSFYATNKLTVSMDMVNGGVCTYIGGAARGIKMFPRFYIYYASNGVALTNLTPGIQVNFTLPTGAIAAASWDKGVHLYVGKLLMTWNYTTLGTWSPTATISRRRGEHGYLHIQRNPLQPHDLDARDDRPAGGHEDGPAHRGNRLWGSRQHPCYHHLSHKRRTRYRFRGSSRHGSAGRFRPQPSSGGATGTQPRIPSAVAPRTPAA